jgi:hypothetical protein
MIRSTESASPTPAAMPIRRGHMLVEAAGSTRLPNVWGLGPCPTAGPGRVGFVPLMKAVTVGAGCSTQSESIMMDSMRWAWLGEMLCLTMRAPRFLITAHAPQSSQAKPIGCRPGQAGIQPVVIRSFAFTAHHYHGFLAASLLLKTCHTLLLKLGQCFAEPTGTQNGNLRPSLQ